MKSFALFRIANNKMVYWILHEEYFLGHSRNANWGGGRLVFMKSLLKKALSQIAIVPALPEFRRPEVIFHDVLHSSQVRCKSSRKNQSRGQLKRLRNELYRKRHSKKVTWKIFSSKNGKLFISRLKGCSPLCLV